jgi:hypothetical protein
MQHVSHLLCIQQAEEKGTHTLEERGQLSIPLLICQVTILQKQRQDHSQEYSQGQQHSQDHSPGYSEGRHHHPAAGKSRPHQILFVLMHR